MDVLRLPYGPWKPLLSGKYEGYDVSLYQNPDRDLFSVLVDADEDGNPKGLVVLMYKGFLVEGPVNDIMRGIKTRTVAITKKAGDDIYQFLLLEGGPKYIGLEREELVETLNKLGNALYKDATLLRNVAKAMGITVTALRDVPKNVAALLLAEPLVLPNFIGSPSMPSAVEFARVLPLGTGRDGGVVKEAAVEFARSAILGEHVASRKRFFSIILENVLLSGIPAVVVTPKPERYEKMNEPGSHEVQKYGITPVGFPRRIWKLGENYFIDLNFVDHGALAETLGISTAQKAFLAISEALKAKKGEIEGIKDIIATKSPEKFHNLRARRVVEEAHAERGNAFGRNNVSTLLVTGDVGNATVIEVKEDLWTPTGLQSLLNGLLEFISKRGKSRKIRLMLFFEDADRILPRVKSPVTEALVRTITELKDYGIGFVLESGDEAGIHKVIFDLVETTVRTVNDEEVGVRLLTKRPFRIKLRPLASNISV
ncbi:MAG: hypothetical protein PWP76_535 [Candidatus Diapherotrites archaeon]|nr:hypothetical protein [Candidatus Diapherotrites archaeon]MDN5367171.1 hypothetical protein [Candidatus Diapherotrites archaeon]